MATKYTMFTMAGWLRQHLVQSEKLREKLLKIATNNQIKRLKECNDVQSVTHVLLTCKNKDLTENRTMFENNICKYVYKYPMFSNQEKLQTVLNLTLLCNKEDKDDVIETICTFVKNTYCIVQGITTIS